MSPKKIVLGSLLSRGGTNTAVIVSPSKFSRSNSIISDEMFSCVYLSECSSPLPAAAAAAVGSSSSSGRYSSSVAATASGLQSRIIRS